MLPTAGLPRASGEPRLLTRDGRYLVLRAGARAERRCDSSTGCATPPLWLDGVPVPEPGQGPDVLGRHGQSGGAGVRAPGADLGAVGERGQLWLATGCGDGSGSVREFNLAREERLGLPVRLRSRGGL